MSRGFMKAHVAVDVATATVAAVLVADDHSYDAHYLIPLVRQAMEPLDGRIVTVLADATYDTRESFDFLHRYGIDAGIRIWKGATMNAKGGSRTEPPGQ